jgi:hypothetical protein
MQIYCLFYIASLLCVQECRPLIFRYLESYSVITLYVFCPFPFVIAPALAQSLSWPLPANTSTYPSNFHFVVEIKQVQSASHIAYDDSSN